MHAKFSSFGSVFGLLYQGGRGGDPVWCVFGSSIIVVYVMLYACVYIYTLIYICIYIQTSAKHEQQNNQPQQTQHNNTQHILANHKS